MTTPISVVGIFDSGLGGLTVVKEILKHIPDLPIIYFGDRARFPYGNKSPETIIRYAIENSKFLLEKGADCIIVACNTATSVALPTLQKMFSIPIFGVIEPAAQKASQVTSTKQIAVIGTTNTIRSKRYEAEILRHDSTIQVFSYACPLLVTLIEEGAPNEQTIEAIFQGYLGPILEKNIDTLLLGCTHYPLIKEKIAKFFGPKIELIDPAESMGSLLLKSLYPPKWKQTYYVTQEDSSKFAPNLSCYSSDNIEQFQKDGARFLEFSLENTSFRSI